MRLKPQHAPFIATQITLELSRTTFVQIKSTIDNITKMITNIVQNDMKMEMSLENQARAILEENQEKIEYEQIDEKILFNKIKKQLAKDNNFILEKKERYSNLAHDILDELIEESCIECLVNENVVKNIISKAFSDYEELQEVAYSKTIDKIKNYKRKLIPGSDEYELIFSRMYEEELNKSRGII